MPIARPKQFPRFLVAALLAANGLLWAVMFFGPLAHLERLASSLTPFDIRPRGYSYAEARAFPRGYRPTRPQILRQSRVSHRHEAEYLHIHFAAPGCYAARVDRVG